MNFILCAFFAFGFWVPLLVCRVEASASVNFSEYYSNDGTCTGVESTGELGPEDTCAEYLRFSINGASFCTYEASL